MRLTKQDIIIALATSAVSIFAFWAGWGIAAL